MAQFTIRDLEQLSGIKAHTIRIWEQRYGILKPERDTANIRSYDRAGLITLLNAALLNEAVIKISRIAALAPTEIGEQTKLIAESAPVGPAFVTALVLAALHFDETRFEQFLDQATRRFGPEEIFLQVVFPFLERIGYACQNGPLPAAFVNFAGNLIVRRLHTAISSLPIQAPETSPRFLLFLPEKSPGEITLLFVQFLLRSRNFPVLYLGQCTVIPEIREADAVFRASHLATFLPFREENDATILDPEQLADAFPDKVVYICTDDKLPGIKQPSSRVKVIRGLSVFIRDIAGLH